MFFSRLRFTWQAMGECWAVLKQDRKLLIFPLLSGLACLAILVSFAVPVIMTGAWEPPGEGAPAAHQVLYYGTLFLFYFCNYFVITFFNAAVVGAAVERLSGQEPTVGSALRAAANRLHVIFGWALVAATVGFVLRVIEERSEKVGQLVVALLGAAWTMTTFLAVPVMVVEGKGPIQAFQKSAKMLRKTWGTQLTGNFGFGLIFFLLAIPGVLVLMAAFASNNGPLIAAAMVCAVIYFVGLALVQSALQSIFQAVLYLYAAHGEPVAGFDNRMLNEAMVSRA